MSSLAAPTTRPAAEWRIIAFFVLAFAAGGVIQPFLNVYLAEVGLSAAQIGALQGWTSLISVIVTPLIGLLADHTQRHRLFLGAIVFLKGLSAPLLLLSSAWGWLAGMASLRIITAGAQDALMNRLTLGYLHQTGRSNFGAIRFWGAVSFAATSLLTGYLARDASVGVLFPLAAVLATLSLAFAPAFPARLAGRPPGGIPAARSPGLENASPAHPAQGQPGERPPASLPLLVIFGVVFLFTLSRTGVETFAYVFLRQRLGAGNAWLGLLGAAAGLAPLPALYLADGWLARYGPAATLAAALALFGLAAGGFALLPAPGWALPLVIVQGFSLALFLVGLVVTLGAAGRPARAATDQMLAQLTVPGLAGVLAMPASGWLYDHLGPRPLFALDAAIALLVVALLAGWRLKTT